MSDIQNRVPAGLWPAAPTDVAAHQHLCHSGSEGSRGTAGVRDGGQATAPLNETA